MSINYKNAKLHHNYTSEGIQLLRLHNVHLNFKGFADTTTDTPSDPLDYDTWVCRETGTVFGISAQKGDFIIHKGGSFYAKPHHDHTEEAIQLTRLHNSYLNFQGFADVDTETPSSPSEYDTWICKETGTVFGISAQKGDFIVYRNGEFDTEPININANKERSLYPLIDPKLFLSKKVTKDYTPPDFTTDNRGFASMRTEGYALDYYSGQYNRLYFLFNTDTLNASGEGYERRVGYYDYDDGSFSTSTTVVGLDLRSTDHDPSVIVVSKEGYIYVAANHNDTRYRIFRSDNPEDISSFTEVADADSIGFDNYNNYACIGISQDLIIGTCRKHLEKREIIISSDQGSSWESHEIINFYDTDKWGSDHGDMPWPYGTFLRSSRDEGVFLSININNNQEDGDGDYIGGYPICGLLYSEDGVNWCNMEYYISNGKKGHTHNISSDGSIGLEEFRDHYAVVDDGFDADENGDYPFNLISHGTTTVNGNVALILARGRRVKNGSYSNVIDDMDICIYDSENYTWNHELISSTDIGSLHNFSFVIVPSGIRDEEVDFFLPVDDAQFNWYRTVNGGRTYRKLDAITDYTDNPKRINSTPHFLDQQGLVLVTSDDATNCNIRFVMFDRRWR